MVAPIALLEVGPGEMDLAIVADGRLLFSRSAVLPSGTDAPVDGTALAGEVVRSFAAYQNEYRSVGVSALLVGGASASLPHINESLDNLLEIPVSQMNGRLVPVADPESLGYVTAIGTAIGADGEGLGRINLIPRSRFERKAAARKRTHALAAAVVVVGIGLAAVYLASQALAAQRVELAAAKKANSELQREQKLLARVKSEHDKVVKTYAIVSASMGRDKPAVEILKAVSDCVPKEGALHLTQFAFDRTGTVSVHGNAKSETAVTDFVVALQASGAFLDVRLPYMGDAQAETTSAAAAPAAGAPATLAAKPKPGENMSFIITCKAKGVTAPAKQTETKGTNPPARGKSAEAQQ
jgi:Tfp pilus assembly protein PilN